MISKWLREFRREAGITREQLAHGICSVPIMSKYERGEREPEKLLADALFQRIGKSVDKFDIMLDKEEYLMAMQRVQIQQRLMEGNLPEAEKLIVQYEADERVKKWPLQQQYIALQKAELLRQQRRSRKTQLAVLCEGLKKTVPEFLTGELQPEDISTARRFAQMEMCLLERFAFLQEEMGKTEKAFRWYEALVNYLEEMPYDRTELDKLYPAVAYRLAKCYIARGMYEKAEPCIERAKQCLASSRMQMGLMLALIRLYSQLPLQGEKKERQEIEAKCLKILEPTLGREETALCFYPIYRELHIHSVEETIRERREMNGMTREELTDGICEVSTLYRAESRQNALRKCKKTPLLRRLGLSDLKYDGGIVTNRYEDYPKVYELANSVYQKRYEDAERIYHELSCNMDLEYITNWQFMKYWDIRIRYEKKEISKEEQLTEIREVLQETIPEDVEHACSLYEHERMLIQHLLWDVKAEGKELCQKLLLPQYLRFQKRPEEKMMFCGFYYCLLYTLGRVELWYGDLAMAEKYFEEGMKEIFAQDSYYYYSNFCYLKWWWTRKIEKENVADLFCAYASSILYHDHMMTSFLEKHSHGKIESATIRENLDYYLKMTTYSGVTLSSSVASSAHATDTE